MIEKPTVFVLGAGASKPFGFPIGRELFWIVCGDSNDKQLMSAGFPEDRIKEFRESLRQSGKGSVDAFLEHRQDFMDIGKAALACALLPYESNDLFGKQWDGGNWYVHLLRSMNTKKGSFHLNKVQFVTFNYDRSLEHYFLRSLKNSYNLQEEEAIEQVKGITILHVYGQLGFFYWQTEGYDFNTGETVRPGHPAVSYGCVSNNTPPGDIAKAIKVAVYGIRIISEESPNTLNIQFGDARHYLGKAERVILVGFGYDKMNVERLGLRALSGKEIYGSAFGFSDLERLEIGERCGIEKGRVGGGHWDALQFLRNMVIL